MKALSLLEAVTVAEEVFSSAVRVEDQDSGIAPVLAWVVYRAVQTPEASVTWADLLDLVRDVLDMLGDDRAREGQRLTAAANAIREAFRRMEQDNAQTPLGQEGVEG